MRINDDKFGWYNLGWYILGFAFSYEKYKNYYCIDKKYNKPGTIYYYLICG